VAENEPQHIHLVEPMATGGCQFDALWNDDWHHAAKVLVTGRREAYYTDYQGTPQEFVAMARRGFLYQGQWYSWQKQPRGTPSAHVRGDRLVAFLENHDQVANSLDGRRLRDLASPGLRRALASLLILGPWTPMLFQGQEYDAATPFLYFADHHAGLAEGIRNGRREFLSQFPSIRTQADRLADPLSEATFRACQLQPDERTGPAFTLYRELIALRHASPAFHDRTQFGVDGAVLAGSAFVLRYSAAGRATPQDRLLVVNVGAAVEVPVFSEPLLSAYPHEGWQVFWSSEALAYGGSGRQGDWTTPPWTVPAESAIVLAPRVA
jgi:maltooligosyltrehalose trehalohydrolase